MNDIEIMKALFKAFSGGETICVELKDGSTQPGTISSFDGEKIMIAGQEIALAEIAGIGAPESMPVNVDGDDSERAHFSSDGISSLKLSRIGINYYSDTSEVEEEGILFDICEDRINRYRIIGAMNNIDKNFVYDISQGLSRRFTFIEILPPEEEYFDDEVKNAKIQAQKRVVEKVSDYGGVTVNESYYASINGSAAYSAAEGDLKAILRHIRYVRENDPSYLGLPIGTAQIIDAFETAYITWAIVK